MDLSTCRLSLLAHINRGKHKNNTPFHFSIGAILRQLIYHIMSLKYTIIAANPVYAFYIRWFLKDVHCNPDEALQIHLDLRSKQSLAIHWGTFPLSDEDAVEPALELARCRAAAGVSVNQFFTMAHGETLFFGDKPAHDFAELEPHMLDTYIKYFKSITSLEVKEIVQNKGALSSVTAAAL